MLQKISILDKCCSVELSILKKSYHGFKKYQAVLFLLYF